MDQATVEEGLRLCFNNLAYSVYIDDSGTGAGTYRSVAVVFPPEVSSKVHHSMQALIAEFSHPNVSEFHFKDIYQGKGPYSGISINERLRIFNALVRLLTQELKPDIFIQSSTAEVHREVLKLSELQDTGDRLTPIDPKNFAMYGVLLQVWEYLHSIEDGDRKAIVFHDAGIFPTNYAAYIPFLDDIIYKKLIYFVDSKRYGGIQIADFIAFSLNRVQSIAQKNQLSSMDKTFLLTVEPIYQLVKSKSVEMRSVNLPLEPEWHLPYIIRHLSKDEKTVIIDTRTGLILLSEEPERKDDEGDTDNQQQVN